jgi:hypothetical protein
MCYGSGCKYEITSGHPDRIGDCKISGRQFPLDAVCVAEECEEEKDLKE